MAVNARNGEMKTGGRFCGMLVGFGGLGSWGSFFWISAFTIPIRSSYDTALFVHKDFGETIAILNKTQLDGIEEWYGSSHDKTCCSSDG